MVTSDKDGISGIRKNKKRTNKVYKYEEVVKYYESDDSLRYVDVAKHFGVKLQYVSKILNDVGYSGEDRRRKSEQEKKEELAKNFLKIFNEGDYTINEIAEKLGVKKYVIPKIAKHCGVSFVGHVNNRKYRLAEKAYKLKQEGKSRKEIADGIGKSYSYVKTLLDYYEENKGDNNGIQ